MNEDYKSYLKRLSDLNLGLLRVSETCWGVVAPTFANPLLHFNPTTTVEDYTGTVQFKSVNAVLFSPNQIKGALMATNDFLMTPLSERKLEEMPPLVTV